MSNESHSDKKETYKNKVTLYFYLPKKNNSKINKQQFNLHCIYLLPIELHIFVILYTYKYVICLSIN